MLKQIDKIFEHRFFSYMHILAALLSFYLLLIKIYKLRSKL
ncbi:hypothetical protein MIDIC_230072 [Alphaproteobacteria bacterium]